MFSHFLTSFYEIMISYLSSKGDGTYNTPDPFHFMYLPKK